MTSVTPDEEGLVDEAERLRLDDQLCFALYAATNAITRRYRPRLGEIGLTYPQYLVMLTLWQDGAATVGQIAARLELEPHAVSPLVGRLGERGLVARRRGADRRTTLVEPTAEGVALERDASRVQAEVACATGLDPDALDALRERLRTLAAELAAPGSRPSAHSAPRAREVEGEAS